MLLCVHICIYFSILSSPVVVMFWIGWIDLCLHSVYLLLKITECNLNVLTYVSLLSVTINIDHQSCNWQDYTLVSSPTNVSNVRELVMNESKLNVFFIQCLWSVPCPFREKKWKLFPSPASLCQSSLVSFNFVKCQWAESRPWAITGIHHWQQEHTQAHALTHTLYTATFFSKTVWTIAAAYMQAGRRVIFWLMLTV